MRNDRQLIRRELCRQKLREEALGFRRIAELKRGIGALQNRLGRLWVAIAQLLNYEGLLFLGRWRGRSFRSARRRGRCRATKWILCGLRGGVATCLSLSVCGRRSK